MISMTPLPIAACWVQRSKLAKQTTTLRKGDTMKWISSILDIAKIPTKLIFWIFLITGSLLIFPNQWIITFRLDEFLKDYGKYLGIGFIGSWALLIIQIFLWLKNKVNKSKQRKEIESTVSNSIAQLDSHEQSVLREFYIQDKHTLLLPIDNPTIAGLMKKGILNVVASNGEMSLVGMLFSVSITKLASSLINPQIVGLPSGNPSEEQIQQIKDSRPAFTAGIERRNWLRS